MFKKFITAINDFKTVWFVIALLGTGTAYAFDIIHKPYVLKSELLKIWNSKSITAHKVEIVKLGIKKGMSTNQHSMNEYDLLISIEKLQILKLGGKIE